MSDRRPTPDRILRGLADKAGVDLDTVPEPPTEPCDVCNGRSVIGDVPYGLASLLCAEHRDELERIVAARVLRPVLPGMFHDARLADLLPSLRDWTPDGGGVYLYGPVGTGKSHQAAALVKRSWSHLRRAHPDRMPRIAWRNVPQMVDDIAATFGRSEAYDLRPLLDSDVLVLDDIGFADGHAFAVRRLYHVLEHRLHERAATIVTSNRDLDDLAIHLDSPQIASRLTQMCAQVTFEGQPDRRIDLGPRLTP